MAQLRELWARGGLDLHSLIWCQDWPHWKPLCLVPELSGMRGTPAPLPLARPRGGTFLPLPSLISEEEAWLRQLREMRARVRQVTLALPRGASEMPTRKMEAVAARRSRRGRLLLIGALAGPVLLGMGLSALLALGPSSPLPSRVLSLMRSLLLWPHPTPAKTEFILPPAARPPRFVPRTSLDAPRGGGDVRSSVWFGGDSGTVVLASGGSAPRKNACPENCRPVPKPLFSSDDPEYNELLDKAFERELGFDQEAPRPVRVEKPRPQRTVYLPLAPGTVTLESLSKSDIVQVVSAHRDDLQRCVRRYAPKRPARANKQRVVMRWLIRPSGSVTRVQVEERTLRGTLFAFCLQDSVRSWTFPEHRVEGHAIIRFPFEY
ncbi:hypothetical protein MEBOL_003965 [Melittangium boletus DSM 14713]|uniref:GYF domain-containing protein n=2 Tax=Melittangium boletus TaxID=83453 RepID=A0A250IF84_9BACT|nr:hypothetical protein MEBOL_003965 [Melittangium boletus DSM 14713]